MDTTSGCDMWIRHVNATSGCKKGGYNKWMPLGSANWKPPFETTSGSDFVLLAGKFISIQLHSGATSFASIVFLVS